MHYYIFYHLPQKLSIPDIAGLCYKNTPDREWMHCYLCTNMQNLRHIGIDSRNKTVYNKGQDGNGAAPEKRTGAALLFYAAAVHDYLKLI